MCWIVFARACVCWTVEAPCALKNEREQNICIYIYICRERCSDVMGLRAVLILSVDVGDIGWFWRGEVTSATLRGS